MQKKTFDGDKVQKRPIKISIAKKFVKRPNFLNWALKSQYGNPD